MNTVMITLSCKPQSFFVILRGVEYKMVVKWNSRPEGGWMLDLFKPDGETSVLAGLPLTAGIDILGQYEYVGIGGALTVDKDYGYNDEDIKLYFTYEEQQ